MKNKILFSLIVLFLLILAFWWGGNAPGLQGMPTPLVENAAPSKEKVQADQSPSVAVETPKTEDANEASVAATGAPAEENKSTNETPAEPKEETNPTISESSEELTCTLSVQCDTVFSHTDWIDSGILDILPADGLIFPPQKVVFYEGESVYDVLLRQMQENRIHFEFSTTPLYNSIYVEGIGNLYEFDCGEGSGWMYKVGDTFPKISCSEYILQNNDVVRWMYTCDRGKDVGDTVQ